MCWMAADGHSASAIRRAKRGSLSLKSVPELSGREAPKTPHFTKASPLPEDEQWCWIKHDVEGYVLARMVADNPDGSATVQTNGSTHVAAPAQRGPLVAAPATLSEGYSDMVKMVQVDEASILHNLKLRFDADKIYTNIGKRFLAAVQCGHFCDTCITEHVCRHHPCVYQPFQGKFLGQID